MLPASAGVYILGTPAKPPHLSWSANLQRRLARLLNSSSTAESSVLGRLRNNLAKVECWRTGSRLESSLLMYQLARLHFPADYLARLRLRIPWFVAFTSRDSFARLTLLNRIPRKIGPVFGPFSNRDSAQRYEEEVLGLFQIRRCTDVLSPHSEHPGCIYGEMNQCLRPCQCAVSPDEYGREAERVREFLASNGKSVISVLAAARERACEETDFEQAAFIHKRIEKVNAAAGVRDEVVTDIHCFNGVALTRGIETRCFQLWPMLAGYWQQPIALKFSAEERPARSLDEELRERVSDSLKNIEQNGNRVEELAIFSRWYYSSWRDGHWFPFGTLADLNYRRLVRAISTMAKADAADSRW